MTINLRSAALQLTDATDSVKPFLSENSSETNSDRYLKAARDWVKANTVEEPFFLSVAYRHQVIDSKGQSMGSRDIFIFNPKKTKGFWFWKDLAHCKITEPHWTNFLKHNEPLPSEDQRVLIGVLNDERFIE